VGKPFPWGTVVGSLVLGALLLGIVAYAALNQGSGIPELVRDPDNAIEGVELATDDAELARNHVAGAVTYEQLPPRGGDHNIVPQTCAIYDEPIAPEHAVHSLEHGAVWLTYNDDVSDGDVEELAELIETEPYGLMSPLPEQESPIVLTAWGRSLQLDDAGDDRIGDFITAYASGPQTPERGAACLGNTSTGPVQQLAPEAPLPSGAMVDPSGAPVAPSAPVTEPSAPAVVPSPAG
jgi:hypothetical protein